MSVEERFKQIKRLNLCIGCFSPSHRVAQCYIKLCKCGLKHNFLLCRSGGRNSLIVDSSEGGAKNGGGNLSADSAVFIPKQLAPKEMSNYCSENEFIGINKSSGKSTVLLSTMNVYCKKSDGKFLQLRAIVDSGSQCDLVTKEAAVVLGLKCKKINTIISGVNDTSQVIKNKISTIISNKEGSFKRPIELLVVPKICGVVPASKLNMDDVQLPDGINLADKKFPLPAKIDLLIGNQFLFDILMTGKIKLREGKLILQNTVFGYITSGLLPHNSNIAYCGLLTDLSELNQNIKRFWEIENLSGIERSDSSKEALYCEQHFLKTYKRDDSGRFIVQMPLAKSPECLGDSKETALRRLNSLWKRLIREPEMLYLYKKFIDEYFAMGHMEVVRDSEDHPEVAYYIPHHPVYRPENKSTPLRVVFSANTVTTSGESLNSLQMNGGVVQDDLFAILLRFRKHKIAITADIKKMFRTILIENSQRDLLRILWKNGLEDPVKTYRLTTVTYGTTCAPYLATRSLKQLAIDDGCNYPLAAKVITKDVYMDDMLSGAADLKTAVKLQAQLIDLLQGAGMQLHKWCSNEQKLLELINYEDREYYFDKLEGETIKTLGLRWNPKKDCFMFNVCVSAPPDSKHSKRTVLSNIARLFDPLGILGPVIVTAKILLQRLWLLKLDWDQPLPPKENREWEKFALELQLLERVEVSRHILKGEIASLELHGFSDASKEAYGAVVYLRCIMSNEIITSNLLCSKSRVAPLKIITIPRLELAAAELLSKLVSRTVTDLNLKIDSVHLWCDSTIVLAWIQSSPRVLKTYVSNRVARIQDLTSDFKWHHVRSGVNPGDLVSRGLSPEKIIDNKFWFHGPEFLLSNSAIPLVNEVSCSTDSEFQSELKPDALNIMTILENNSLITDILNLTNNYVKLIRIISFLFRFLHNVKPNEGKIKGPLSRMEINTAENFIIREVQREEFSSEIAALRKGLPISSKSRLKCLNVFLDKIGILRVGGRLTHSEVSFDAKFPIVLPAKHNFTRKIMQYHHLRYLHTGAQALLYSVRQRFWPLGGRNLARKIVRECITCFKYNPIISEQLMGNLPSNRVNPNLTFNNCGVDFCGPFQVKTKNQRKGGFQKMYVAVFICLATKAIHLEMVSDLSTEALIATLKRFFARRGKCASILSDNGTNFVGAKSELTRLHNLVRNPESKLRDYFLSEEIKWSFIPPRAPHFGGLWEAGVKSFKHHFRRTVGISILTLEEFLTLVTQIEGILNSRPITPLSTDPNDLQALTPGHFLIGRPITAPIEPEIINVKDNRLSRWGRITKMVQTIWKHFQNEYLSQLHERNKWQFQKNNINIGAMVLLREDNIPACHWILGRINEVIPGKDGNVRVVVVKTAKGLFKRPVSKISILPIDNNN